MQMFLLHQHQLQNQTSATNIFSFRQHKDKSMSNALIWQPWRDMQQAAVHHRLYEHQQNLYFKKETRLTSKELPTTAWRRERRLRTGEYHHPQHHSSPGFSANSVVDSSSSLTPPPNAHVQPFSNSGSGCGSGYSSKKNVLSSAHHLSIMMAAAASICPLNESTNHTSSSSTPSHSILGGQTHLSQTSHSPVLQHINLFQNDDAPLDMSVSNLKQRNSPPPPYREPLPGSQFASSLARPSVITQAPPKRNLRDSTLVSNQENDNRSCEAIDEHFRRSLGNDYFSLFSKRSHAIQSTKSPSPQPHNLKPLTAQVRSPSPTLHLSSGVLTLPPQSALTQSEIVPPPAYPSYNQQHNSQQAHSGLTLTTPKVNNVLLSTAAIGVQQKISKGPNSPPFPLTVRPNILQNHQHSLVLQKSPSLIAIAPLLSPQSTSPTLGVKLGTTKQTPVINTSGSRTVSPISSQQQTSTAAVAFSNLTSIDNSPSSSPRHTPPVLNVPFQNTAPNLPAIMRIKTEPGLQNIKSNNPTPPASPTICTNYNINFNSTNNSSNTSSPSSPKISSWKSSSSTEVIASVDDHFAKALGDTWKKLQENKEIRK